MSINHVTELHYVLQSPAQVQIFTVVCYHNTELFTVFKTLTTHANLFKRKFTVALLLVMQKVFRVKTKVRRLFNCLIHTSNPLAATLN
jgi:hypothetical protein